MKKEIGGYMELENFSGKEYYPELHKVNLGRTALLWILESRKCKKLLVPHFLCDSVIDACKNHGVLLKFYRLDASLMPVLPDGLKDDEWLYLVNYYGQLTDDRILYFQRTYSRIIVDHTHAFYQSPLPGVDTLYSCRKFFGLSDGAYLSTDAALTPVSERDHSSIRMEHILGRYEEDAGTYYQKMLDNASTYHHMNIRRMSRLTENLLCAIDYTNVKERRESNYHILKELLPSDHPFTTVVPAGPFAYPYYHPEGIRLRKLLAAEKIFVPTNWSNVLHDMPQDSMEYQWAANILPLPCDQRYGKEEMQYLADTVLRLEKNL